MDWTQGSGRVGETKWNHMKTLELVFVGIKGSVVALNRETGEQVWAISSDHRKTRRQGSGCCHLISGASVAGEQQFLGIFQNRHLAYNCCSHVGKSSP